MNWWKYVPERFRLWAPPLLGIPAMLLLGDRFELARFLLFTHHLFWMIGIILLIPPLFATFAPPIPPKGKAKRMRPLPVTQSRPPRPNARQNKAKQQRASSVERPAERLVRLQKEKEVVDQKIGRFIK